MDRVGAANQNAATSGTSAEGIACLIDARKRKSLSRYLDAPALTAAELKAAFRNRDDLPNSGRE